LRHAISPYGTIAWTDSSRLGIPLPRGATALPWRSSDGDSPAGIVAGLTKTPLAPSDARRAAVYAEAVMHKRSRHAQAKPSCTSLACRATADANAALSSLAAAGPPMPRSGSRQALPAEPTILDTSVPSSSHRLPNPLPVPASGPTLAAPTASGLDIKTNPAVPTRR
jgi:hypothetical protein